MKQTRVLERESVGKLLFKFSLPAIIGTLVNATYNLVDRIFIGQAVGEGGLAAATVAFPVMLLLMGSGMLIGYGTNTLISMKLGEKKTEQAEALLGQAFAAFATINVLYILILTPLLEPLLKLMGATPEILPMAVGYTKIIVWGNFAQSISFGMNSFIRGEGRPKVAMVTMFIGAILNLILDPLFLFVFKMGVEGAALATVIAQSVSALHVLDYFVFKRGILRLRLENIRLRFGTLGRVMVIGSPMFLMHAVGSILQGAMNIQIARYAGGLSIVALSVIGVINSVSTLCFMPMIGLSQGMQPIVGYKYGAKLYSRVRATWKLCIKVSTIFCIFTFVIIFFFPQYIFPLFAGDAAAPEFIPLGTFAIRRMMFAFPVMGLIVFTAHFFQSTGRPKVSIMINMLRQVFVVLPLIFILPYFLGLEGILYAVPIADTMALLISLYYLRREMYALSLKEDQIREGE